MKKRIFSLLLVIAMVVGMIPTIALAEEENPSISKVSMTLTGVLSVNFLVDAGSETDMSTYALHATDGSDLQTQVITDYTVDSEGLYVYTAKIAAHRLQHNLTVKLMDGETEVDSLEWVLPAYVAGLKEQEPDNAELAALLDAIVNYSTYANAYAIGTGAPVEAVDAVERTQFESSQMVIRTVDSSLDMVTSLYLDDACDLRIKFNTEAFDGCTLLINGEAVDEFALTSEGNRLVYAIEELLPQDLDTMYNIRIVKDEQILADLDYSVLSYAYLALGKAMEPSLHGLLKALYLYNAAADAYIAALDEADNTLTFQYRYGAANLIQVNTNLPATTPIANFLTTDNGCSIDQSANEYQQIGWIGMADADGTIVLTFNFGSDFSAGQTYVLPAGAVFGFTDGSSYTLDMNYTFTYDGSGWTMEAAEPEPPSISLTYRYGTDGLIQYNTDLPATTPIANFLASDNGCALLQSGDQNVGWIGMADADGTIVLTFNFNASFEAGQSYTLSAGSVFGFTDGSSYTLNSDITLYWDGSNWSGTAPAEPEESTLSFTQVSYGTDALIQVKTDLPATTPCVNFTAGDNGCNIDQSGNQYQQFGWVGMDMSDDTIYLTFHFNSAFEAGQTYVLPAGAVFGFTDGSSYTLDTDYTFTFDGSSWTMTTSQETVEPEEPEEPEVPSLSFAYRYGAANLIQVNTNLPATTPCANFLTTDNGCSIDQSANEYQQIGWIGMADADGTIVLTFNFNSAFTAGQTYVLPAGAVFGFTDGSTYTLDANYTFTFDGSSWTMTTSQETVEPEEPEVPSLSLSYRYGAANLIQYNTDLPATTPIANFLAGDNGCALLQGGDQNVGWIGMADADGTVVLTFNFNASFEAGQSYTLSAGSVFGFTDGNTYTLTGDVTLYWDGSNWSDTAPVPETDVLDAGNFTGGEDIITFADLPVDSTSTAAIETYKSLGFNTSLLTEDYTDTQSAAENYKVTLTTANEPENTLNFAYRYGTSNLIQVNTNLPATTPIANFLTTDNGCSIDQSANEYQQIGWIGMADADGTIVLTFNFGSDFSAGQTYVLPKGAVFGFTDGSSYTLDADYTFTFDGSNWSMNASTLNLTLSASAAKYIQLKTDIPAGLSYGDFLLNDTSSGHNVILETTEGAQSVAWFSYSELSGAVYLTFNFSGCNKPGTQYILKAGTALKAGDNVYTTDRDYILTVSNAYLTSLENLDNAGLNVWIRNHHNTADYFTDELTAVLKLYEDVIDGFYMVDEAFQTNALLTAAGQASTSSDFGSMLTARDWFNSNFADKYYHSNQVPVTSYDHYNSTSGETLSQMDADAYKAFLQEYKATYNDQLTGASGASVSFDNYPFAHAQGTYNYGLLNLQSKFESGIESTYLLNCLLAAQVAAEDDFGLCIQTFEATDTTYGVTRDITSAAEVSLQLYTGMAMGADLFEYFAYSSNGTFNCIMNQDGTGRIYDIVKEGNEALCFSDVVGTFTWNGIVTSAGSTNSHNTEGFAYVENMVLTNLSNGVLESYSSTDDAIIGCFTKGELNGYMVVNYNDPIAVTGDNTVSLSFADCTRARIYTCVDGQLISELVELTDGACTVTLEPGSGCFVIPA